MQRRAASSSFVNEFQSVLLTCSLARTQVTTHLHGSLRCALLTVTSYPRAGQVALKNVPTQVLIFGELFQVLIDVPGVDLDVSTAFV